MVDIAKPKKKKSRGTSSAENARRVALMREYAKMETDECIMWPHATLVVSLDHYTNVNRVICTTRNGDPDWPAQPVTLTCGNAKCCNYRHMRWASCTRAVPRQRRQCDLNDIVRLRRSGLFVFEIAQRLNVSTEEVQEHMEKHGIRYR